ncbi:hypothetical protein ACIQF8_14995 [Pseudarthrobacter sp. NPDC092184]|uniref:hypothetical protein n=1 Tax=unclassified Pseudarthrobacter TaxID=2647000 RepID=UPI0037F7407D
MSSSLHARLRPPRQALVAGPWSAEVIGDELAHISYAGRQVLRAVKAVVRDQDWQTPQPSASDFEITRGGDGVQARWTVDYIGYGVEYKGELTTSFTPAAVQVDFVGVAAHAFRSNRIGLVVLHPPSDAGRDITVEHSDGSSTATRFPDVISPHQPFVDVTALEWADAGTAFRLTFTGDVFETEDQRNWTDASFKTYSTPLSRPFPVSVAAGTSVRQSVLLEAATLEPQEGVEAAAVTVPGGTDDRPPAIARIEGAAGRVPALAVGAGGQPELLPAIPGLDAFVVELAELPSAAPRAGWDDQLRAASDAAASFGGGLDIRAVSADPVAALPDLARFLPQAKRLAVFHPASHLTEPGTWQDLKAAVHALGFNGSLLAGARSHFTELNRNSGRMPSDFDALTFSITPQMHSTEPAHIIDSVPIQRVVAQNALRLGGGKPLHVGPVTLKPRFNAVATSGKGTGVESDELQGHPITAAWLLASISALTVDGVASVSYFEASGPNGISDASGQLNPAGELLKELAALRGSAVFSVDSAAGPAMLYPVQSPAALTLFAGNLSGSEVFLDIQLPSGTDPGGSKCAVFGQGTFSFLDFTAGDGAAHPHGRLTLGPWSAGVVRFPAGN